MLIIWRKRRYAAFIQAGRKNDSRRRKAFVILESGLPKDEAALKRLCREKGRAAVVAAAAMQDAKSGERNSKKLKDMLKRGECFTADMLAVGGDEIMQMGIKEGKKIGDVLNLLVDHVIDNPNDNNREKLLKLVVAMRDKESYNTIANE